MEKIDNGKSILLLESIKKAIETYNKLNPNQKIGLSKLDYTNVSNICACCYNNNKVGLFYERDYKFVTEESQGLFKNNLEYNLVGSVYLGVNSHLVGVKIIHDDYRNIKNHWAKEGEFGYKLRPGHTATYDACFANCNMTEVISFDDLRSIMYSEGLIGPYQIGKATDEEMLEVLKYARGYFGIEKPVQKRK